MLDDREFQAHVAMSVPNLKRIALCVQMLWESQNFEIGQVTQATPNLGSFYGPYTQGSVLYAVPNLKRIALICSKVTGGPKISKFGHVTQAMPT